MVDRIAGLILAAGAGTRFGMPKALVVDDRGVPWLHRASAVLRDGGCDRVLAVLGARAEEARRLLPPGVDPVDVTGMALQSDSLRAGLAACADAGADAAVITLIDLPELTAASVSRVIGEPGEVRRDDLRRAAYDGHPGHPVLIGRGHWAALGRRLGGDAGAGRYLAEHGAVEVDCTDLGGGTDVDRPRRAEGRGDS